LRVKQPSALSLFVRGYVLVTVAVPLPEQLPPKVIVAVRLGAPPEVPESEFGDPET
jgi:hypothetical protein